MPTNQVKVKRAKKAIDDFDHKTRPVVRQIVDLAQQGVQNANAALRVGQANIDKIADAAVEVGHTQADLSTAPPPTSTTKRQKSS